MTSSGLRDPLWSWPIILAGLPLVAGTVGWFTTTPNAFAETYSVAKFEPSVATLASFAVSLIAFFLSATHGRRHIDQYSRAPAKERLSEALLIRASQVLLVLTLAGYGAWFGLASVRAGGIGALAALLQATVAGGGGGLSEFLKRELLTSLPGVTTMTQFGPAAIVTLALLGRMRSHRIYSASAITAILVLGSLRVLLNSERLALVELLIPLAFIALGSMWRRGNRLTEVTLITLGVAAVFLFFGLSEYSRSWANAYRDSYSAGFWHFVWVRFTGYYSTAVNNGFLVADQADLLPFRPQLEAIFQFPLIGEGARDTYDVVFGVGTNDRFGAELVAARANPEYVNVLPVASSIASWSHWGAPVWYSFLGLISGWLHGSWRRFEVAGTVVYPIWAIGLLELGRIEYWTHPRALPSLLSLLGLVYLITHVEPAQSRRRTADAS